MLFNQNAILSAFLALATMTRAVQGQIIGGFGCESISEGAYDFRNVWGYDGFGPQSLNQGAPIGVIEDNRPLPQVTGNSFLLWDVRRTGDDNRYSITNRQTGFSLSSSGERAVLLPLGTSGLPNDDFCFVPVRTSFRQGQAYNIVQLSTGRIAAIDRALPLTGVPIVFNPAPYQAAGRWFLFRAGALAPAPTPAPTVPLCKENGQTCDNGETCCNTLTCQATPAGGSLCLTPPPPPSPPLPTCGSQNESCAGANDTCCGNLLCRNTANGPTCLAPDPVCQSENSSCSDGETCCGALICQNTPAGPTCLFPPIASPTTPTPPVVPTPPTAPTAVPPGVCQSRGLSCANGQACCVPLTCQNTRFGQLCRPPIATCQRRGLSCANGQPCCGLQNTCQNTSVGPVCRPAVAPVCQTRGNECGNGVSCCSGLTCQVTNFGNLCRPGVVRVQPPVPVPVPVPQPRGATFDTLIFLTGPSCANVVADLTADVTVFGPTDVAFSTFLASTGLNTNFLCGAGVDTLRTILTYHVIPGAVTGNDIRELIPNTVEFETLNGGEIAVDTVTLRVNNIQISVPDARRNQIPYVLHGIDAVLVPSDVDFPTLPSPPAPTPPTGTCQRRARSCAGGQRCCSGLTCQSTNFGLLCRT